MSPLEPCSNEDLALAERKLKDVSNKDIVRHLHRLKKNLQSLESSDIKIVSIAEVRKVKRAIRVLATVLATRLGWTSPKEKIKEKKRRLPRAGRTGRLTLK